MKNNLFRINRKQYSIFSNFNRIVGVLFLIITYPIQSQNNTEVLPKSYIAYHTKEAIKIDGLSNEKSWNKVNWSDNFIDIEGKKIPKFQTRMKMMWDDSNLYFLAELKEPHIWGDITKRDAIVFYNNDFEIFIDPDGDTYNYYEFEMNARNTIWDLFITKPYRDHGLVLNNWDYKNIKTAVHIKGTLNDPGDIDDSWQIEIAIPWKSINETYTDEIIAPRGKTWRINFSRVNWDFDLIDGKYKRKMDSKTGKYLPEYNWVWSPQWVINLHEPERWGYVLFSEKNVGEKDTFQYGKDEMIKQKLFKIYRDQLKHEKPKTLENKTLPKSIIVKNKKIDLLIETTIQGYIISVKSPFTEKVWFITQNGKIGSK